MPEPGRFLRSPSRLPTPRRPAAAAGTRSSTTADPPARPEPELQPVMQPLPRSLAPLPGESIVGYLLRLAHRLAVSPSDLARMAGWLERRRGGLAHLSRKLLLELGQKDADSFAELTRLTVSEAHSLTLGSWKGHYPPIQRSLASAGGPLWSDSWLFLSSPRYCPQCLAGDGSPIQQQLGGPWKKQWHLPVVFACIEHRAFLRDRCPERPSRAVPMECPRRGRRQATHQSLRPSPRSRPRPGTRP